MSDCCDPVDCIPPGSSVHAIFQARILEWIDILSSGKYSQSRDQTCISCIAGGFLTVWATREVHKWFLEKELLLKTKY